jgi:alkyl sulfatase BDS1-like metallo-beta-lactamase superfamily hydrolase
VRLRSEDVGGTAITLDITLTDIDERWVLALSNRALHAVEGRHDDAADATITTTRAVLVSVTAGARTFDDAVSSGDATIDGDPTAVDGIFDHLDVFMSNFPVVEP